MQRRRSARPLQKKPGYQDMIRKIAKNRDVEFLLHFTQFDNLAGIVKHGLLSRRALADLEDIPYVSNQYRLDGNDDAVSVSISRWNRRMFTEKRKKSGHPDWVILGLQADILWTHKCRFFSRNAGRREFKYDGRRLDDPWTFEEMFSGSDEGRSGLEPCHPTNPQAEVQVLTRIEPERIVGAIVDRQEMVEPVSEMLSRLPGDPREVVIADF
jgi:hypothetical protein